MHRGLYWVDTQLKGTMSRAEGHTAGLRAPSASALACIEGLLLCKGRALLSSEALLGSAWETLMEWPTEVQTLSRLNKFWQSSALVLFAAGLCYGVQAQMLAWPGGLPGMSASVSSCSPPLLKVSQLDWRTEPISSWPENKSEILPVPSLTVVLVSMREFACFFL